MNILLVCAAGASTGILVKKMLKFLEGTDRAHWRIEAHPVNMLDKMEKEFDVVLLGPQIAYQLDHVKKQTEKPVDVINAIDYGMGRAENVINQAIKLTE
ncbi:PTS sugar transporter subunit IIB [Vallitalea pronyensis]|uniref:PTS sugar transporter subunit IIB n=2 Tax=Vallitalea pronyensis TaxID=1348613 RepID=A0A8J8MPB7_9FIRM|nr:PTS sugar transporter subunit IIB [Vallitalea pronyensis]